MTYIKIIQLITFRIHIMMMMMIKAPSRAPIHDMLTGNNINTVDNVLINSGRNCGNNNGRGGIANPYYAILHIA